MNKSTIRAAFVALAALIPATGFSGDYGRHGHDKPKALETVYTLSNAADDNEVLVFQHFEDGSMAALGHFSTGGTGTGGGLGNQGALALSKNGRYLFAVNAGSNDVSVFKVRRDGLALLDRAPDPGSTPVSVTVDGNRVYVVNDGDDSIFGFEFDRQGGKLLPLQQSYNKLSGDGTDPAQISFDRDGEFLVVTEKASNKITTFALDRHGLPTARHIVDSAGITPFGFAFGKRSRFFVSEAQAGDPDGATASSYELLEDGSVRLLDGEVAVGQTAACWLATTPDGRVAFTADTPADAISSFRIDAFGHLALLETRAAEESRPRDLAVSPDGRTLYTLNGGDASIGVYRIRTAGALEKVENLTGLPAGITGLVVR
ncbi:MAG: lactonase family protein [Gammaproteobacteria bacterium]